jgi:hypothetical protein
MLRVGLRIKSLLKIPVFFETELLKRRQFVQAEVE